MDKKIKLFILSGFLGSGKTTFLLKMLDHLKDKKVGVIMNEFGKIGIDGPIIKRDDMELMEINRGSIFCSCLKISFLSAMVEMSDREMDYLIVESSGLADPSNIGDILDGIKQVKGDVYDYKGAICLIDGTGFLEQLEDLETVERQLKHCHLAILNKVDLIDEDTKNKVLDKIEEINPKVNVIETSFGEMDFKFLEEDLMKYAWAEDEETTNSVDSKPKTLSLTYNGVVEKSKLTNFLNLISKDAYRIKGFCNLQDGINQVDIVNRRIDYKLIDREEENSLVIISKIGPQIIKPIFAAWESEVGIEMKLR